MLETSFLSALIGVVPYTVIGAVCAGVMLVVVCSSARQEIEEVKEGGDGGKAIARSSVLRKKRAVNFPKSFPSGLYRTWHRVSFQQF